MRRPSRLTRFAFALLPALLAASALVPSAAGSSTRAATTTHVVEHLAALESSPAATSSCPAQRPAVRALILSPRDTVFTIKARTTIEAIGGVPPLPVGTHVTFSIICGPDKGKVPPQTVAVSLRPGRGTSATFSFTNDGTRGTDLVQATAKTPTGKSATATLAVDFAPAPHCGDSVAQLGFLAAFHCAEAKPFLRSVLDTVECAAAVATFVLPVGHLSELLQFLRADSATRTVLTVDHLKTAYRAGPAADLIHQLMVFARSSRPLWLKMTALLADAYDLPKFVTAAASFVDTAVSSPSALALVEDLAGLLGFGPCVDLLKMIFSGSAAASGGNGAVLSGLAAVAPDIANGGGFNCAIKSTQVYCWGKDDGGQLGTTPAAGSNASTLGYSALPLKVPVPAAEQVVASGYTACALLKGGQVDCWGDNGYGELGRGNVQCITICPPARVVGLPPARQISAGPGVPDVCALAMSGSVYCWGYNFYGQLGVGVLSKPLTRYGSPYSDTPLRVHGISDVAQISVGFDASCALLQNGRAECWGDNFSGELGDGTRTSSSVPVVVSGISNAREVAGGDGFACALLEAGDVSCWGSDIDGLLGAVSHLPQCAVGGGGDYLCRPFPAPVPGLSGVRALTLGAVHACALVTGGRVDCWGSNYDGGHGLLGRSGIPTHDASNSACGTGCSDRPLPVPGLPRVVQVASRCALAASDAVYCWGPDMFGQLGIGKPTATSAVVRILGL